MAGVPLSPSTQIAVLECRLCLSPSARICRSPVIPRPHRIFYLPAGASFRSWSHSPANSATLAFVSASRPKKLIFALDEAPFAAKRRKELPHQFVLEALSRLSPRTRPMFGCIAVYVEDKIVLALRDKPDHTEDNGVWLATTEAHHASLGAEFPNMRSIPLLGKEVTGWQVLPARSLDFEEAALHACELIIARDPRIGKVPKAKRSPSAKAGTRAKASSRLS